MPTGEPDPGAAPDADLGAVSGVTAPDDRADPRVARALRGAFAATLGLEALTVLFVPRAIAQFGEGLTAGRLAAVLGVAGLLLVAALLQRRRLGLVLGSVLQPAVVATGLLTGAMYVLGALFAAVWIFLLRLRRTLLRSPPPTPPP